MLIYPSQSFPVIISYFSLNCIVYALLSGTILEQTAFLRFFNCYTSAWESQVRLPRLLGLNKTWVLLEGGSIFCNGEVSTKQTPGAVPFPALRR